MALPLTSDWLELKNRFGKGDAPATAYGLADALLQRFDVRVPPVPIEQIVRGLGISLVQVELDDAAGAALAEPQSAHIWVKAQDPRPRKRFTLAHELGHVLLHPTGTHFRDLERAAEPSRLETQANTFAAELLMPAWMVRAALQSAHTVEELAALFDVSAPAMGYRLKDLGLT